MESQILEMKEATVSGFLSVVTGAFFSGGALNMDEQNSQDCRFLCPLHPVHHVYPGRFSLRHQ